MASFTLQRLQVSEVAIIHGKNMVKVIEVAPALVLPVELHLVTLQQPGLFAGLQVVRAGKQDVQRRAAGGAAPLDDGPCQCGACAGEGV